MESGISFWPGTGNEGVGQGDSPYTEALEAPVLSLETFHPHEKSAIAPMYVLHAPVEDT